MPPPVPDDIYANDVDFTVLALRYPEFAKRLKPNRQLDFTDPESVRQLTYSLLHLNHNLTLTLPPDRLCPPVPNRFNYILHLQRLLDSTSPNFRSTPDSTRQILGIDIGTGASCIYPLLACRQRPLWRMLATEIDDSSRKFAQLNIDRNDLGDRIKLIDTDSTSATLIPSALNDIERIDFLMTNPPFYASERQMLSSAKGKSRPANSSCTGAAVEMIYPFRPHPHPHTSPSHTIQNPYTTTKASPEPDPEGGEVAFLTQLLSESLSSQYSWRTKIQWFTAMLGHLSSLSTIITRLRERGCTNYAVWEFVQGSKTRRWGVAWSWMGFRPANQVARGVGGLEKRFLPVKTEINLELELRVDVGGDEGGGKVDRALRVLGDRVNEEISELEFENENEDDEGMQWQWKPQQLLGLGMSRKGDCWSRKARRKKERKSKGGDEVMDDADASELANEHGENNEEENEPELVFKISLTRKTASRGEEVGVVNIRWLQGQDSVLFESFCGWLKRKIET